MEILNFSLRCIDAELPAIRFDDGTWYFSAQATCVLAELASANNAVGWVRRHVPSKWTQEIKIPGRDGRPGLYLTKPGFYYAICQGKSDIALKFRDEVFEVILPKIDAEGGYIAPHATQQQLEAHKSRIAELEDQNKLLADNRQLTAVVQDFMLSCIDYVPNSFVRSAEWSPAFKQWVQSKYGAEFYNQLNPTGKEVVAEMDRILKLRSEPKNSRIHIDVKNRFGDLENAALKPKDDRNPRTIANYSHYIGE